MEREDLRGTWAMEHEAEWPSTRWILPGNKLSASFSVSLSTVSISPLLQEQAPRTRRIFTPRGLQAAAPGGARGPDGHGGRGGLATV